MIGKILVAIILIIAVVMVFNHLNDISSFLKNTKFFDFNLSFPSALNGSGSSTGKNQKLPFPITPGYRISPAPSSSYNQGVGQGTGWQQPNTQYQPMQNQNNYQSAPQNLQTQPGYSVTPVLN